MITDFMEVGDGGGKSESTSSANTCCPVCQESLDVADDDDALKGLGPISYDCSHRVCLRCATNGLKILEGGTHNHAQNDPATGGMAGGEKEGGTVLFGAAECPGGLYGKCSGRLCLAPVRSVLNKLVGGSEQQASGPPAVLDSEDVG